MADTNHTSSQNPIMVLCGRAFSAEAVSIIEFTGRLVKYSANPASRLKICLSDYKTTARAKVERKTILNTHLTLFYHCFYQMTGDYAKNRTERRGKKMQNAFKVFKFLKHIHILIFIQDHTPNRRGTSQMFSKHCPQPYYQSPTNSPSVRVAPFVSRASQVPSLGNLNQ